MDDNWETVGDQLETLEYFWIHILLDTLGLYYHDIFLGRNGNLLRNWNYSNYTSLEIVGILEIFWKKGPIRRDFK